MTTEDSEHSECSDGIDCAWDGCSRSFESTRSMKVHHAMAHDEKIGGTLVSCAWCGEEKRKNATVARQTERSFCDDQCKSEWQKENLTGEDHPSWQGGVTVNCEWCDEPKEVTQSEVDGRNHFCDQGCLAEWRSENIRGENHPRWNGGDVTVECSWCGETKDVERNEAEDHDHHFCDNECRGLWQSENRTGERVPTWTGGKLSVECEWCGREKKVDPHRVEEQSHFYCNSSCQGKWLAENQQGEDAPAWEGGAVTVECAWCGEPKEVIAAKYRAYTRHYCNQTCQGKWLAENSKGENNPNWVGGHRHYGAGWTTSKRESVRESQGRMCAGCGAIESELDRKLHVHHIQPARTFDDGSKWKHDDDNLVALCGSCHTTWELMTPLRPQTPFL